MHVGDRFGRLVILKLHKSDGHNRRVLCRCDCGTTKVVWDVGLRNGNVRSCTCMRRELKSRWNVVHGEGHGDKRTPEYKSWEGMKERCYNKYGKNYLGWGGRGIRVCDRWRDSYLTFLNDMGRKPGAEYSLDRVDNDGNYEPSNCRWATPQQQAHNRRRAA